MQKKRLIFYGQTMLKPCLGFLVVDPLTGEGAQTEVPNSFQGIDEGARGRSKRKGHLDLIFRYFAKHLEPFLGDIGGNKSLILRYNHVLLLWLF